LAAGRSSVGRETASRLRGVGGCPDSRGPRVRRSRIRRATRRGWSLNHPASPLCWTAGAVAFHRIPEARRKEGWKKKSFIGGLRIVSRTRDHGKEAYHVWRHHL